MPIGYSEIEQYGRTVEILEEHAEVWLEVPENSLGRRDNNVRACVGIGHMLAALRDAGYTITPPIGASVVEALRAFRDPQAR